MHSKPVINALKIALRARDITYRDIAKRLGVAEITVKRWFSAHNFSLERFYEVLQLCGLELHDLDALTKEQSRSDYEYTEQRELFLASSQSCLAFFDLLLKLNSPAKAATQLKIAKPAMHKFLLALDRQNLIQVGENWRVRFHQGRNMRWRKSGPLRTALLKKAKSEFLNSDFGDQHDFFKFMLIDLSADSSRKIEAILNEVIDKAKHESSLDGLLGTASERVGVMVAKRRWNFSTLENPT